MEKLSKYNGKKQIMSTKKTYIIFLTRLMSKPQLEYCSQVWADVFSVQKIDNKPKLYLPDGWILHQFGGKMITHLRQRLVISTKSINFLVETSNEMQSAEVRTKHEQLGCSRKKSDR